MEILKRMRIIKMHALLAVFILIAPSCTVAGWEVSTSTSGAGPITPREPFFHSKIQQPASPPRATPSFRPVPYHSTTLSSRPIALNSSPARTVGPFPLASLRGPETLGQPRGIYAVSISGSLKENIERIMSRYHWRVVWKSPYDYNFDGRIVGSSLPNVIEKLLQPFPLKAVMYMSNRTLAVTPRPRYKA